MENVDNTSNSNKKHIEPRLHFARQQILVGEDEERMEKVTVSELVRQGQPLLSFPDFQEHAEQGLTKIPIRAGKNTLFSEDGETLLADIMGYPRIDTMNNANDQNPSLLVSVTPFVKLTDSNMKATLCLHPPIPNGFSPASAPLPELLVEAGILFGIKQSSLQQTQELITRGYGDFLEIPIAFGKSPEEGEDAYLEFALEIGPITGQLLEDGSIDFRERRIMIGVEKDQLLATKIPAIPGTPGTNVLGEQIAPRGGTPLTVKIKNDVSFSEETGKITASKDGVLTVVNKCEINVCSKHELQSDVDYTTGNINSKSCVLIHGAVQPGFKVIAGGDLEVRKEVMSATLSSDANIIIKGGITGQKTAIKALGDVDFNFIEQGKITSGGNIIIRKQSYYSGITAIGSIRCKPGSTIIGGEIVAGDMLTADNVGSPNGKPALLAAGVDHSRLLLQRDLSRKLIEQQNEIIQKLQLSGGRSRSKRIKDMDAKVDEIKRKLIRLNLIPGTKLFSRVGADDSELTEEGMEDLTGIKECQIEDIFIDISGTVFVGTELTIGNCSLIIKNTINKRRFKLNNNHRQIIAVPLR